MEKKYFGLKRETTNWSYSHGQPVWLVDAQKMLLFSVPLGIGAAIFHGVTGLSMWFFIIPVGAFVAYRLVR